MGIEYINIGSPKACLFCHASKRLLNILAKYTLLHLAIEEAIICAQNGYYAAGILAFSQTINLLGEDTPEERHKVAHDFLKIIPTQIMYDDVLKKLKNAAEKQYTRELSRKRNPDEYTKEILQQWTEIFGIEK